MLKYLTEGEGEIKLQQESRGVTSGEVFSKVFESRKNFTTSFPRKSLTSRPILFNFVRKEFHDYEGNKKRFG